MNYIRGGRFIKIIESFLKFENEKKEVVEKKLAGETSLKGPLAA